MQILAVGEILWDVMEVTEHLGGAPLNFSAAVQRLGHPTTLVSGVGEDIRGTKALDSMAELGLSTKFVQVLAGKVTGTAVVTRDAASNATYFIKRPAAFDEYTASQDVLSSLEDLQPGWIYFGTLAQTHAPSLAALESILKRTPDARRFYDMNLREGHWNLPLVERLSAHASVLKLNDEEAKLLFALTRPHESFSLETFCRSWAATYSIETVCVTSGSKGCAVFGSDSLYLFPGYSIEVVDTVGAGDAFAAGFLHGLIMNWPIDRQAIFANALGALVASRLGAIPAWTLEECRQWIAERGSPESPANLSA